MKFEVTILGCGAALPANGRNPSSQVINIHDKLFLMDCGEGTQQKVRSNRIKMQRIGHIFISHLHGDHYLGLMGLLSSFNLLGRTAPLVIVGPEGLQEIIELQLRLSKSQFQFEVDYEVTNASVVETVMSSKFIEVISFPLKHKIPTTGFLFRERDFERKLDKYSIEKYKIPIKQMHKLKAGEDLILDDGRTIPNKEVTKDPPPYRSYAYCSDTAFLPDIVDTIKGVDLLYHEATFINEDLERAVKTKHSTAAQAAQIAQMAEVGELLLGHFSARYKDIRVIKEEAETVFSKVTLAEEDVIYPVGIQP